MIVHTNIEKYTILYTIMHGPQICTINKRLVNLDCRIFEFWFSDKNYFLWKLYDSLLHNQNCVIK